MCGVFLTFYLSQNYIRDTLSQKKAVLFLATSLTSVMLFLTGYELMKPNYTFKEAQELVAESHSLEILSEYQPTIIDADTNRESYLVTTSDGSELYKFTVNSTTGAIEKLNK